jgi:hypothetical protein
MIFYSSKENEFIIAKTYNWRELEGRLVQYFIFSDENEIFYRCLNYDLLSEDYEFIGFL